ncbi:hypothetical protein [Robertmurraya siralis]|uniref:hypothetical protein n=1 Tax=Robertmurraya siralis TaxID=77777 RepID=UPI0010F80859|nr:hypothetical protein [Robertmurraya siralis]
MAYYGNQNKKSIIYLLDNTIATLKDKVKDCKGETGDLWKEYRKIEKVLYGEGKELLSMTNKVKFESRLNTVKKMLEKSDL